MPKFHTIYGSSVLSVCLESPSKMNHVISNAMRIQMSTLGGFVQEREAMQSQRREPTNYTILISDIIWPSQVVPPIPFPGSTPCANTRLSVIPSAYKKMFISFFSRRKACITKKSWFVRFLITSQKIICWTSSDKIDYVNQLFLHEQAFFLFSKFFIYKWEKLKFLRKDLLLNSFQFCHLVK